MIHKTNTIVLSSCLIALVSTPEAKAAPIIADFTNTAVYGPPDNGQLGENTVVSNLTPYAGGLPNQTDGWPRSTATTPVTTSSSFAFTYDLSGEGLGAAETLEVTVSSAGGNLEQAGPNGIAVVGGDNDAWWENSDGALSFSVKIFDAGDADVTSDFNFDVTGVSLRWGDLLADTTEVTPTLSLLGEIFTYANGDDTGSGGFDSSGRGFEGFDVATGETNETSFSVTRTFDTVGQLSQIRFDITAVADVAPSLDGFTYDSTTGDSEVSIVGAASTAYILVEASDLDFSTPDQSPIPLTGATVGTLSGNEVTTDAGGNATVQFNLGTTKDATFIRAEVP